VIRSVPLRVSKETTYITEPLKSDGRQVDYLAAWQQETSPEGMATDDNGYRLVVKHLGKMGDAEPGHFAKVCEKLGLVAADIEPDMTFQEPYDFLTAYVQSAEFDETVTERLVAADAPVEEGADGEMRPGEADDLPSMTADPMPEQVLEEALRRPWTLDDLPMMESWLAENGAALDMIGEAVAKPEFHIPLVRDEEDASLIMLLLPEWQTMRSIARALSARANYRIGTGDLDGAIDDMVACKRLGRHTGRGGMLIQMLVGIAIEGIGDAVGIAGALEHRPSKEQLERLMGELDALPAGGDFQGAMRFERYMTLDTVQGMAHGNRVALQEMGIPGGLPAGIGIDWNVVARRLNQHHDTALNGGMFAPPTFQAMAIVSTRVRSELLADTLGALLLPACEAAREAGRRRVCTERLKRIALAMLLYERDHGTLPPVYTVDEEGNPLHSWRVELLPYVGQSALYESIRLDEPWDSEHNRQFHGAAVSCYQCPSGELAPGHTTYAVVVGGQTAFDGGEGKRLADFGPRSATMVLVAEGRPAVCWMAPAGEIPQSLAREGINLGEGTGIGMGSNHPGGCNCGLRDGSVRFVAETIDPEVLGDLLVGEAARVP